MADPIMIVPINTTTWLGKRKRHLVNVEEQDQWLAQQVAIDKLRADERAGHTYAVLSAEHTLGVNGVCEYDCCRKGGG